MRLYPLEPTSRVTINIASASRNFQLDVLITKLSKDQRKSLRSIILLADGTPDDIVTAFLAKHLDGENIVAIAKTHRTRLGALGLIPTHLKQIKGTEIEKLFFLMDQEDEELSGIYESASTMLERHGMTVKFQERMSKRLRKYCCSYGGREFTLILIVNGLDEINSSSHTIEDHLLYAGVKLLGLRELEKMMEKGIESSKDIWKTQRDKWESVYRRIRNASIDKIGKIFPQHVEGLKLITQNLSSSREHQAR